MNKTLNTTLHFYQGDHVHMALSAATTRIIFRNQGQALAEQHRDGAQRRITLVAADSQGSVVGAQDQEARSFRYTAFGYSPDEDATIILTGFNGEIRNSQTGCYLLGNGYRCYIPSLMRFSSPDNISPFGSGGYHSYVYCGADPVNFVDRTGHMRTSLSGLFSPTTPPISVRKAIVHHKRTLGMVVKRRTESRAGANQATGLANESFDTRIVAERLAAEATTPTGRTAHERIVHSAQDHYDQAYRLTGSFAKDWHRDNERAQHLSQHIAALERTLGASFIPGDHSRLSGEHAQPRMVTIRTGHLPKLNLLR